MVCALMTQRRGHKGNQGLAGSYIQAHIRFVVAVIRIVLSGTVALAIIVAVIYFSYSP